MINSCHSEKPVWVVSLNDGAKVRLFSEATKFRVAIRRDFAQLTIRNLVNKLYSYFCEIRNYEFSSETHSFRA